MYRKTSILRPLLGGQSGPVVIIFDYSSLVPHHCELESHPGQDKFTCMEPVQLVYEKAMDRPG